MLDIATNIMQKIFNFSYVWRLEFFVKGWNMYEAHISLRPLQQICRLETTPLCLNTRLRVNKNFKIHINFIEINLNVSIFCSPGNDKYNPSYSTTYLFIKGLLRTWFLCFNWISFFCILRSWKARFSHHSISPNELCTHMIKVVGGQ